MAAQTNHPNQLCAFRVLIQGWCPVAQNTATQVFSLGAQKFSTAHAGPLQLLSLLYAMSHLLNWNKLPTVIYDQMASPIYGINKRCKFSLGKSLWVEHHTSPFPLNSFERGFGPEWKGRDKHIPFVGCSILFPQLLQSYFCQAPFLASSHLLGMCFYSNWLGAVMSLNLWCL